MSPAGSARALGAGLGAVGVALGAFGAHALGDRLPAADLAIYETAVRYQMYHALALLGVGAWLERQASPRLRWAVRLFGLGVVLFSGTLYFLVLTGPRWLGAITPIGGASLIGAWGLLVWEAVARHESRPG